MPKDQESSHEPVNESSPEKSEHRTAKRFEYRNATGLWSSLASTKKCRRTAVPGRAELCSDGSPATVDRSLAIPFTSHSRDIAGRYNDPECYIGYANEDCTCVDFIAPTSVSSESFTPEATQTPPPESRTSNKHPTSGQARPGYERTIKGMRVFNQEVDDDVKDRFREVQAQLELSLIIFLHKTRVEFRPIALQLLVLGLNEHVARPWIVVYCPKEAKRKVKSFFREDSAKAICHGPPSSHVKFDVVVGGPLIPSESDTLDTVLVAQTNAEVIGMWMQHVKVMQSDVPHYATMGGFVCTTDNHGNKLFYGLTVGHILSSNNLHDNSNGADSINISHTDIDIDTDSESDDGCSHDVDSDWTDAESSFSLQDFASLNEEIPENRIEHHNDLTWASLGHMLKASYSDRARNRDWALVELAAMHDRPADTHQALPDGICESVRPFGNQRAILCSKSRMSCTISGLPARAVLPSGHEFVDVNVLRLSDNQGQ
jgi:hypothetical protein